MKWVILAMVATWASSSAVAGVVSVAGGLGHTCTVMTDGELYCWGRNANGQLGLGDLTARYKPTRVPLTDGEKVVNVGAGQEFTCAHFKGGYVKCWGNNTYGQLGLGTNVQSVGGGFNQEVSQLPPIDLGKNATVKKLSVGHYHACALLESGEIKCWGYNAVGALGLGDNRYRGQLPTDMGDALPVVNLGKELTAVDLISGSSHNCALLNTGALKCWGDYRGIGAGKTTNVGIINTDMGDNLKALDVGTKAAIKQLAAGTNHTCLLFDDNTVKCFGLNSAGSLGIGKANGDIIGDAANELGAALPFVSVSTTKKVARLFAGGQHSCAILEDSTMKCWGQNANGQLGLGDVTSRGTSLDHMGEKLPVVNLGTKTEVRMLALGHLHTCALFDNGELKCWGMNQNGQLGNGTTATVGTQPSHMGDALKPIKFE